MRFSISSVYCNGGHAFVFGCFTRFFLHDNKGLFESLLVLYLVSLQRTLQILLFIFLLKFFMMIFSVSLSALELRANDISLLDLSFRTELADLHRRFFDRMGVNRLMFSHNSTG